MQISKLVSVCAVLAASMSTPAVAYPDYWLRSSINAKNNCIVPIGFKPPGGMMRVQRVLDAKNGPKCRIEFKGDTITVYSNIPGSDELGYIVQVTEGTVVPRFKDHAGTQGPTCAYGAGDASRGYVRFTYTPPDAPTGKPIVAAATCGTYAEADMFTTYKVEREE